MVPLIAGPTLLKFGTAEQKQRYLPAMLRGDEVLGSRFFGVRGWLGPSIACPPLAVRGGWTTTAVRGAKLWSSYADLADMMFALVRTGFARILGRHGISYLLIQTCTPTESRWHPGCAT